MNNHEHRTEQTYVNYSFQPVMSFWGYPAGAFAKERRWALLKKRDFNAGAHFPFFSLSPFPLPLSFTQAIQMVESLGGDVKPFTLSPSSLHIWPQISIQWIVQLVSLIVIHWILIIPVDKAIQSLNNRGQLQGDVRDHVPSRDLESLLRQMAKVNLYHVTRFFLHLSLTHICPYTQHVADWPEVV